MAFWKIPLALEAPRFQRTSHAIEFLWLSELPLCCYASAVPKMRPIRHMMMWSIVIRRDLHYAEHTKSLRRLHSRHLVKAWCSIALALSQARSQPLDVQQKHGILALNLSATLNGRLNHTYLTLGILRLRKGISLPCSVYLFVSIPSTANIAASMGVYHIGKLRIVVVGDFLNIGVQAQTRLKFGSFPSLSLIQTQARRHQSTNRRSRSSWASNGGTNTWCAVIFHTPALPNKVFPWLIYCLHFGRPDQV